MVILKKQKPLAELPHPPATQKETSHAPDAKPVGVELRLHAAEAVATGLSRLAIVQTRAAINLIDHPRPDRAEDVHDVRVAIKRLRAYLRLVRPFLPATLFRRETGRLRTAARDLAPWRDALVARDTLACLADKVTDRRDRAAFARALVFVHGAKAGFSSEGNQEEALQHSRKAFEQVEKSFSHLNLPERGWMAIGPGLRKVYRQNRRWMRRAWRNNEDDAFHEWRKQAKYLFYQLQIIAPAAPKRLAKMLKQLKQLLDVLGTDHDLVVLEHMLHSHPAKFGGVKAIERVARYAGRRRVRLRRRARKIGKKLYAAKPVPFTDQLQRRWDRWNDW